jgi:hypothetical protein
MYCKKCGSLVGENDNFCRYCGRPVTRFALSGMPNVTFQTRVLFKGITIGISIAVLAICAYLAYSLYISYPDQYSNLIRLGISPNVAHDLLYSSTSTISFCVLVVIVSCYFLVFAVLDYFSAKARAIMNSKKLIDKLGNGFTTVGLILSATSAANYVSNYYSVSDYKPVIDWNYYFIITGSLLFVIGISLYVGSYFRISKQARKFKEQNTIFPTGK